MKVCCGNCALFMNGCKHNVKLKGDEVMTFYCVDYKPSREKDSMEGIMKDMAEILKKDGK